MAEDGSELIHQKHGFCLLTGVTMLPSKFSLLSCRGSVVTVIERLALFGTYLTIHPIFLGRDNCDQRYPAQ